MIQFAHGSELLLKGLKISTESVDRFNLMCYNDKQKELIRVITEFGKALRKLRIDRGEILKTMAEKLNMTSSYLSAIECGKRNIPSDLISKLASIYDLTKEEQEILSEARDKSLSSIEIELGTNSTFKRDLALQFARKFDDIDDELAVQILKFLNRNKEE